MKDKLKELAEKVKAGIVREIPLSVKEQLIEKGYLDDTER